MFKTHRETLCCLFEVQIHRGALHVTWQPWNEASGESAVCPQYSSHPGPMPGLEARVDSFHGWSVLPWSSPLSSTIRACRVQQSFLISEIPEQICLIRAVELRKQWGSRAERAEGQFPKRWGAVGPGSVHCFSPGLEGILLVGDFPYPWGTSVYA